VEGAYAEHAADDRGEPAQDDENRGVTGGLLGARDERLHQEADHGAHDDPDSDADPVLHWTRA
jgi:hypothetical protein